jgi:hypothetical protein
MSKNLPAVGPSPVGAPPQTSMTSVVGWLAIVFAAIPLLMVLRGDEGHTYLFVGTGLLAFGIGMLIAGRLSRRPR